MLHGLYAIALCSAPNCDDAPGYDIGLKYGQSGLCAKQAAREQDPTKLLALTQEINRLLEEKDNRLEKLRLEPPKF
jgi:hypothetical protein